MLSWNDIRTLNRARRSGASLGDIAAMKFAMLAGPAETRSERLRDMPGGCLEVDMASLRRLPDGTVGREYARHLDDNGLSPLDISDAVKARYAADPYPLRYTTTHDLVHVLTGFPTTPAGEIGLFAFMIGQGFGTGRGMLWLSTAVYAVLMPLHLRGLVRNIRVGLRMAKEAESVLAAPLEELLSVPLAEARRRLGLRPETIAAIAPGHVSLLANWLVKPKQPVAPQPAL